MELAAINKNKTKGSPKMKQTTIVTTPTVCNIPTMRATDASVFEAVCKYVVMTHGSFDCVEGEEFRDLLHKVRVFCSHSLQFAPTIAFFAAFLMFMEPRESSSLLWRRKKRSRRKFLTVCIRIHISKSFFLTIAFPIHFVSDAMCAAIKECERLNMVLNAQIDGWTSNNQVANQPNVLVWQMLACSV